MLKVRVVGYTPSRAFPESLRLFHGLPLAFSPGAPMYNVARSRSIPSAGQRFGCCGTTVFCIVTLPYASAAPHDPQTTLKDCNSRCDTGLRRCIASAHIQPVGQPIGPTCRRDCKGKWNASSFFWSTRNFHRIRTSSCRSIHSNSLRSFFRSPSCSISCLPGAGMIELRWPDWSACRWYFAPGEPCLTLGFSWSRSASTF